MIVELIFELFGSEKESALSHSQSLSIQTRENDTLLIFIGSPQKAFPLVVVRTYWLILTIVSIYLI